MFLLLSNVQFLVLVNLPPGLATRVACLACGTIENYYPYSRSIITPKPYSDGTLLWFGNNLQRTIILESYSGGTLLLLENADSMHNDDIFDHTRGYTLCTQYNPIAEAVIRAFYPFGRTIVGRPRR